MTKLQIPFFNDVGRSAATLADLPRTLPGISRVQIVLVADGSTGLISVDGCCLIPPK